MFSELVARNSRRSRRENGLFFTSLVISIIAFYIILSLSHQDVMVFLQRMESSAVDRLLSLVPVLYGLTLFILFFLVYYANRFQLARRRHEFGVYLDGVLAPSMTEGKSLMNAIADMNALLDPLGLKYESYLQNLGRELFYIVAASYLTIYLAVIFLVVANTIIGVQFLMGQQKAARRYRTLVRLGAEHDTLCRAAKTQINWYFGLPVGVAAVSSVFGVRALFSGILSTSAQSGMTEMMIAAGAMILLLCVVEWLYMAAVKRSSSRYLLGLMAPEREE